MKEMSWDEYYASFYDWSLSTQKSYSYRLSDFGDSEEVYEVVVELAFYDQKFATRFVEKALAAGVKFTPDHVLEMTLLIEKPVLSKMDEQTSVAFTKKQLEDIYMLIEDASFERISKKQNIDILADDDPEEVYEPENENELIGSQPKRPGFFATLFGVIAGVNMASDSNQYRHNGRCNGDCTHCHPHYGYRYGRWYYGHDHVHVCEFGGNKGSGSMD